VLLLNQNQMYMKIAVIDNFDSFVFNLIRYLKELGCEVEVMRNHEIKRDVLEAADGILLSPGPGVPKEAGDLLAIIEQFHASKPMLGVCLGHQALGEFFGANLIKSQVPIHGEARSIHILENNYLFQDLENELSVGRYHSWVLELNLEVPLIPTAVDEKGEVMALRHKTLPVYGVQFHPESILTPNGRKMLENWVKGIEREY
jgi:anthranilate synthase component II